MYYGVGIGDHFLRLSERICGEGEGSEAKCVGSWLFFGGFFRYLIVCVCVCVCV